MTSNSFQKTSLEDDWKSFWDTVRRPRCVFLLVATVVFAIGTVVVDLLILDKYYIKLFLFVLFSTLIMISGTLFGVFYEKNTRTDEEKLMKQKGQTSIRTLTSVLKKLGRLRDNIKAYRYATSDAKRLKRDLIDSQYKGLWDIIDLMQEDVKNAIRDWDDILPEIDTILKIKDQQVEVSEELDLLKKEKTELKKSASKKKDELKKIEDEIDEKKKEWKRLNNELGEFASEYQPIVSVPTISGVSDSLDTRYLDPVTAFITNEGAKIPSP